MLVPLALAAVMCVPGCAADAGTPRMRLGSLPFPGMLSLYEAADPCDLGMHCSGSPLARIGRPGERERGTLYSRKAGFIDLSHVRESIDWVAYLHCRVRAAFEDAEREGRESSRFTFDFCEARFEITTSRLSSWPGAERAETAALIDDASLRAAQRLCVLVTTWHEIATWYGHQTVPGVPEHWSAFTWDDTTAHVLGARIGAAALRNNSLPWDEAVTAALDLSLRECGVVSKQEQNQAAELVHNRWWKGWSPVRRDLDTGLASNFKVPWLVEEFGNDAAVLELPSLDDVLGLDLREAVRVRIVPARWIMRRLMCSDNPPEVLLGEAGLLDAVERTRDSMRKSLGDGFDQP